jgi:PemK-like, MazF-like toxin of type II toxin-antitoxin system
VGGRAGQRTARRAVNQPSKDSVANVSQIVTLDKSFLVERVGKLSAAKVELLLSGIDVVLGRLYGRVPVVRRATTSRCARRTSRPSASLTNWTAV